ncbi:MAG: hypothetical protein LBQ44_03075 [Treponema sp.]|jgi:tetratricopeptide (TPR) repeat protein|nr:hypothetical protein [Treponema sp.]
MKKISCGVLAALCLGSLINAQEWVSVKSQYYEILAPAGNADAVRIGKELDLRFEAYNGLFHFDPSLRRENLKVRLFTDKAAYDEYVGSRLGSTRDGAVYLHYSTPENRELVINRGNEERVFAHQAFVQFLRAFIANPPSWIREGAAVYFNGLKFNAERGVLDYEENLAWLDTVKKLNASLPGAEAVLLADKNGIPANFQAASWILVSFFLSGNRDNFRIFTDALMVLSPDESAEVNSDMARYRIGLFNDMVALNKAVSGYIASKKSFNELVNAGQKAYTEKNFNAAESSFKEALELKKDSYVPHYFLGLVSYELKAYDRAERYYQAALGLGAGRALVQYARGVNAAAAGKKAEARQYLRDAADASPAQYKARAEALIDKLK